MASNKWKKKGFTFESNADKIAEQIMAAPEKVLSIIARNIRDDVRKTTLKSQYDTRTKVLSKALQWAWDYDHQSHRKNKAGIQIGFKASVDKNKAGIGPGLIGDIITGEKPDPIKPSVLKNKDSIVKMIADAIQEITKKK